MSKCLDPAKSRVTSSPKEDIGKIQHEENVKTSHLDKEIVLLQQRLAVLQQEKNKLVQAGDCGSVGSVPSTKTVSTLTV